MSTRFQIARLGAGGDGVAETSEGPVFIPFTLPGETVTAAREEDRGTLMAVLEASPLRVEPVCRYFTECGGCALQHMEQQAYLGWKRDKVVHALKSRGIETEVAATVACAPHSRRRATFSARRTEAGMLLGYNRAHSHHIIDIEECPIVEPEIEGALPMLRRLSGLMCHTQQAFHLTVTHTGAGLEVAAQDAGKLEDKARMAISDFAIREGLARVSVDGEIVVEPKKPFVTFGDVSVAPPPGSFLQAVASAEATMAELVGEHLEEGEESCRPVCWRRRLCAAACSKIGSACGRRRCGRTRSAGPRLSLRHRAEACRRRKARPVSPAADLQGARRL